MENFLDQLGSPEWWIGVVVVGILINLVSVAIARLLSDRFIETNQLLETRSAKQNEKFEETVEFLSTNPYLLAVYEQDMYQKVALGFLLFIMGFGTLTTFAPILIINYVTIVSIGSLFVVALLMFIGLALVSSPPNYHKIRNARIRAANRSIRK
jgi:hypothetical protein